MGEQSLDELRVKGPPGALPRLGIETVIDSDRAYNKVVDLINYVRSRKETGRYWPEDREYTWSGHGEIGLKYYPRSSSEGLVDRSSLTLTLPFPDGEQTLRVELDHNRGGLSATERASITREVLHLGNRHIEQGTVIGRLDTYSGQPFRRGKSASFSSEPQYGPAPRGPEPQHTGSVISPDYILKAIKETFPQLAK